jgi:hypothetical protein
VTFRFAMPLLTEGQVANLLAMAGVLRGVGGWRQEKGSASYGQFELVSQDNPDFKRICKTGGRAAQDAALKDPEFYDGDTEELFRWFEAEVSRRHRDKGNGVRAAAEIEEEVDA